MLKLGNSTGTERRTMLWRAGLGFVFGLATVGILLAGTESRPGTVPAPATTASAAPAPFPVVINRRPGPPQIAIGQTNFLGQPVMASCASCHTTTKPDLDTRRAEDLDQFHQGLTYKHGNLTCLSCHNATDYETLRLADTRPVAFADSMTLCSQCHGPQRRDYDQGLHGGMNGHWDLTRGGRTRNTCVNCHDPHAPAFPTVMPVLAPRDRISVSPRHTAESSTPATHP
jgi:formate-dependent nitrite reductase cytochrome c552 subunit